MLARKDGATGWLTFNNPERRNAVSVDMWEALPGALEGFEADPEVRVIVLAGVRESRTTCERMFSSPRRACFTLLTAWRCFTCGSAKTSFIR